MGNCAGQKRTSNKANTESKSQQSQEHLAVISESDVLSKRNNHSIRVVQPPLNEQVYSIEQNPFIEQPQILSNQSPQEGIPNPIESERDEPEKPHSSQMIWEPEAVYKQASSVLEPPQPSQDFASPVVPDEDEIRNALQVLCDMNCDPNEEFEEGEETYIRSPNQTQNFFVQGYKVLNDRNANDNNPTEPQKPKLSLFIDCDQANLENYESLFLRPERKP